MTNVLLAVDENEHRARRQAEEITDLGLADVSVTILHVFTDNTEGASVSQFGPARRAREVLEEAGIDADLAETSGAPGVQVVEYAEETGADVVCVAGRKRSPAGKAVFGSVSQEVMLNAEMPVLYCPVESA